MPNHPHAKKRFGQNFLTDNAIIYAIIDTLNVQTNEQWVEIGPGRGALTEALVAQINHLDVIEIDRDLIVLLQQKFSEKIRIHHHDVLAFDFTQLIQPTKKLRIVGNLPYNISTPLLLKLFQLEDGIQDIHVMLQKEVGLRLAAQVGSSHYSRLSVMAQYFCDIDLLFEVPPQAFTPIPKVDSVFIRLIPRAYPVLVDDFTYFSHMVKTAFNQRRKTIANSLNKLVSKQQLTQANIDPRKRPQELSVLDFVTLSQLTQTSKLSDR